MMCNTGPLGVSSRLRNRPASPDIMELTDVLGKCEALTTVQICCPYHTIARLTTVRMQAVCDLRAASLWCATRHHMFFK